VTERTDRRAEGNPVAPGVHRKRVDPILLAERFRPLPGRRNVVVTRDAAWSADGAEIAHSLDELLDADGSDDTSAPVWVIGGGEIYAQSLARASRLEVTEVELDVEGDTRAPMIDHAVWQVAHETEWLESRTGTRYRFVSYERRN
jgi:dihydrofolate reductase